MNIPDQHAVALHMVAQRLGLDARAMEPLAGGSRNHLYRVGQPPQAAAVRLAGEGDAQLGVFRDSEVLAQRAAAERELAPRVLYVSVADGVMADEWLPGQPWERAEASRPERIRDIAQWLQSLHAVPAPSQLHRVDFLDSLLAYCGWAGPERVPLSLVSDARRWHAELGPVVRRVLCHHDLHHSNILGTGAAVAVVDWEYAGLGDPVMDLASYASYHQLDDDATRLLLGCYGGTRGITLERLAIARRLFEAVSRAWVEVMALCGALKKQS